jgi:hypothetical protein
MQCNSSGWSSPARGAQFGIISYDWSNAKKQWAAAKPMDCEDRLLAQAKMTKKINPASHVFVYRNVVKALPWFKTVREKLDDPQYSGFFLKFESNPTGDPTQFHVPACAAENTTKCSEFYHDQEQTPAVPTSSQPHPDGSCTDGVCDVGKQPCGEYLFDHRNGSMLRDFIVQETILGSTGLGDPSVDGTFIDDFWCSNLLCKQNPKIRGCPCNDPVQGPTEINKYSQEDMGLSDEDIRDITVEWNKTMTAVQQAHLDHGAYTWSLIPGQDNADASPTLLKRTTCVEQLEEVCGTHANTSSWQLHAKLFGLTINGTTHSPAQLNQDLAFFLLARGRYAWLGWGVWGMTWPFNPEPAHGELPPLPHGVPRPEILDSLDVGTPLGLCTEKATSGHGSSAGNVSRTFTREWSKVTVEMTCGGDGYAFEATITKK